jgi:hypothetical protein
MKFPAVAVAICFTSGIAMRLWPMAANRASSRGFYFSELAAAFLLLAAAIFLLSRERLRAAAFLETSIEPYARGMHRRPARPRRYFFRRRQSLRTSQSAAPRAPAAGWYSNTAHRHQRRDSHTCRWEILQVSCFVACPEVRAQVSSAKPHTPQDQQSN